MIRLVAASEPRLVQAFNHSPFWTCELWSTLSYQIDISVNSYWNVGP